MKLRIYIERLVLEGLPVNGAGPHHVQDAVRAELERLLSQAGLAHELQGGGVLARLKAAEIAMMRGDTTAELGKRIAQAVHGAIADTSSPPPRQRVGNPSASTWRRGRSAKGSAKWAGKA